jgi:hypothetical protein
MPTPHLTLLANVGSNDVKQLPGPTDVRTRDAHGDLLAAYEAIGPTFAARVEAPILRAYLNLIIARHGRVDTVILFGTDQPNPHPQDTIDGAHVLARWARDTYGDHLGEVRVVPIEVDGVHLYDRMTDWYAAVLPDVVPFDPAGGRPRYLVGITGGTPAQSVGILTGAIGAWGDAVEPVYVPDTRDTGGPSVAVTLRVATQLRRQAFRQPVATLLERGWFEAAAQVLDTWGAAEATAMAHAARAIQRWLDADLAGAVAQATVARRALREAGHAPGGDADPDHAPAAIEALRRTLAGLHGADDDSQRFSDLYWNAALSRDHGRLADFVGRTTFLAEAVARWVVGDAVAPDAPIWDALAQIDHAIEAGDHPRGIHPTDLAFARRCLRVLVGDPGRHVPTAGVRGVRNRSIVAHGFGAVSEGEIAEAVAHDLAGEGLGAWGAYDVGREGTDAVLNVAWRLLGAIGTLPDANSPYVVWGERLARATAPLAPMEV